MERIYYIAELDQDVDDIITAEYLYRLGILEAVVLCPYPKERIGRDRLCSLKNQGITILDHLPSQNHISYVLVGGALTTVASYIKHQSHQIVNLGIQGGFCGTNIVPQDDQLEKFRNKLMVRTFNLNMDTKASDDVFHAYCCGKIEHLMMVGKNVCHSEVNTLSGIWSSNSIILDLCKKYQVNKTKRLHDVLAAREFSIRHNLIAGDPVLDYQNLKIIRTIGGGIQTLWGACHDKSENTTELSIKEYSRECECAVRYIEEVLK